MNNFPAMTEERRQELVKHCKYNILQANGILPTLEGIDQHSEVARKVRKELELQEIALAALTSPPAPVLNLPGEISLISAVYAVSKITHESLVGSYQDGWNACLSEVKRLNTQPSSPEASNEQ